MMTAEQVATFCLNLPGAREDWRTGIFSRRKQDVCVVSPKRP